MEKVLRNKKAALVFILPAVIFFVGFIIVPICTSLYYSLNKWDGIGEKTLVGIGNYIRLLTDRDDGFLSALLHASILAVASIFIQLPISLFFAAKLARGVRGERFYLSTFFIPVIISTTVIGQLWMKIYNPQNGLLNALLTAVGLGDWALPWLGMSETALIAAIIPILWQYIGYHMLLMYSAIKAIPVDVFEAAKIDGATNFQTTIHITLPLLKPVLKVCTTFAVVGSFKSYDLIHVLTRGGPAGASEVPSTLMVEAIFSRNLYGYGSAMAIVIVAVCFLLAYIIRRCFKVDA